MELKFNRDNPWRACHQLAISLYRISDMYVSFYGIYIFESFFVLAGKLTSHSKKHTHHPRTHAKHGNEFLFIYLQTIHLPTHHIFFRN